MPENKPKPVSKRTRRADPSDPYVIDGTDVLIAIERTMGVASREQWLARAIEQYPRMDGAKVADVLELLMETDAFLPLIEPYLDGAGAKLADELGGTLVSASARAAIVYASADYEVRAEQIARAAAGGQRGTVSFGG